MVHFKNTIIDSLFSSFRPFDPYDQPQVVDLAQQFSRYSFLAHFPQEQKALDQLMQTQKRGEGGKLVTLAEILKHNSSSVKDFTLLKEMGFRQLKGESESGIVLQHDTFKDWLIKKNYSFSFRGDERMRICKMVNSQNFPSWMLPAHLRTSSKKSEIGIKVPHDVINPLRVVMLDRGKKWIKNLDLNLLKAGSEYLYLLPHADQEPEKPFYLKVVVLSKKENILDESAHINRLCEMAIQRPHKLKELARQIALFIKFTHLTDNYLGNFRFLDDDTDRVLFFDGEPIGALADPSDPRMLEQFKEYDPGFFPLLGLKCLQDSIPERLEEEQVPSKTIQIIQKIFDQEINKIKNEIISERGWRKVTNFTGHYFPFLYLVFSIFAGFKALLYTSYLFLNRYTLSRVYAKS